MVAATNKRKLSLAIIGAGIGGLTTASALLRLGIEVQIYEQASRFARIGAGIQQTPNAIKVLRVLGVEERLRRIAFRPLTSINREWDTGALTNEYPLGDEIERRFGAPHLLLHRGDLHGVLAAAVPSQFIYPNQKLVGLEQNRTGIALFFANGARAHADAVVGADGIHSRVREIILGPEQPRFTGRVAYRTPIRRPGLAISRSETTPNGGDQIAISSSTTLDLTARRSISSPALPNPTSTSNRGQRKETSRPCASRTLDFIRMCAR